MLPGQLRAVDLHYRRMQRIQASAVKIGRQAWRQVDPAALSASWRYAVGQALPAVVAVQVRAATEGAAYGAPALAEQGIEAGSSWLIVPSAFGRWASDGRPLDGLLYSPITHVKALIGRGIPVTQALHSGRNHLDTILRTQIADAGRAAAGVDITTRPGIGYVRMLNPPSCDRCLILAGRWYRYSAGFRRHPRCDCTHVPTRENIAGDLRTNPKAYFDSLTEAEQNRMFGRAAAQAIRDGADMNRLVNLRMPGRGAHPGARLTPEDIYSRAGSRADAVRLLNQHGYIVRR